MNIASRPFRNEEGLRVPPHGVEGEVLAFWSAIDTLDNVLGSEYVDSLLAEKRYIASETNGKDTRKLYRNGKSIHRFWIGLPHGAHYRILMEELLLWGSRDQDDHRLPFRFLNNSRLPQESLYKQPDKCYEYAHSLAVSAARERSAEGFYFALCALGIDGISRLLGLRQVAFSISHFSIMGTQSKMAVLPPCRDSLERGASSPSQVDPKLTEAAAKLCSFFKEKTPRNDGSIHSWGDHATVFSTNFDERNTNGELVIKKILDSAVFMSYYQKPKMTHVLELRIRSGFGAQWTRAGKSFIGFIRPPGCLFSVKEIEISNQLRK